MEPGERKHQHGQGMIEYVIATAAVAMLLLVRIDAWGGRSVIELVADAITGYYKGYAYAVSLSELPDIATNEELRQRCLNRGEALTVCDNALNLDTHKEAMELLQAQNLPSLPSRIPTPDLGDIVSAAFGTPVGSGGGGGGGNGGGGTTPPPPEPGTPGGGGASPENVFEERDDGFFVQRGTGDIVVFSEDGDPFKVNGVEISGDDVVISGGSDAGTVLTYLDGSSDDPDARKVNVVPEGPFSSDFILVYDDTGDEVPGVSLEEVDLF